MFKPKHVCQRVRCVMGFISCPLQPKPLVIPIINYEVDHAAKCCLERKTKIKPTPRTNIRERRVHERHQNNFAGRGVLGLTLGDV